MTKWRIIFDYDDTLIRHDNDKELQIMLNYLGVDAKDDIKAELINYYTNLAKHFKNIKVRRRDVNTYMYEMLPVLRHYGITTEKFLEAQRYKDMNYSMIMEDTIEVLEYLKSKNYFMCILTNWFYEEQAYSLKAQSIYDYFDRIYAWDDYYAKPDRRAFIRALSGTKPEDNIMVGNCIENDIAPAKELGIYTFGYNLNKKGVVMPDVELNSLKELKFYL